jgi:hypothetical protein
MRMGSHMGVTPSLSLTRTRPASYQSVISRIEDEDMRLEWCLVRACPKKAISEDKR